MRRGHVKSYENFYELLVPKNNQLLIVDVSQFQRHSDSRRLQKSIRNCESVYHTLKKQCLTKEEIEL